MTMIKDGVYRALGSEIPPRCDAIRLLLLTDGYPSEPTQHYAFSNPASTAWQNTREVFLAAGIPVNSFEDLVARGILLATCLDSTVPDKVTADEIRRASRRLERLLAELPSLRAIGLMGGIAIDAFNRMHKRLTGGQRLIPAGSTYKTRGEDYFWGDIQVLPSYLHTGKSFLIERSKQRMVADGISRMLRRLS